MGTFVTITLSQKDKKYFQPAFQIIKNVEKALSSYDKNSPIYKLNHHGESLIYPYTYEALRLSEKYYKKSDGYFDIAIGKITKDLYHFGEEERLPSSFELEQSSTAFSGLHFNTISATLSKGIKIDLGGMGKGFGVDKVAVYFRERNISAVIAASGDIRCLNICPIEINNPQGKELLLSFFTKDQDTAISTSGNYNRYVASKSNNHLINPKTKYPQQNFLSITLISHLSNAEIDAYATAASVMPKEKAYDFLDSLPLAYVILQSDGKKYMSKNIDQFVKVNSPL